MKYVKTSVYHQNFIVTDQQAVDAKIQVLRDFYIVDDDNEDEIRNILEQALKAEPHKDRDVILDREAKKLIEEKLK